MEPLNWNAGEMNTMSFHGTYNNPGGANSPEGGACTGPDYANPVRTRCYWDCTPDDDPNKDCKETVFSCVADYCGSPTLFCMPSDKLPTSGWAADFRPCYAHDGAGMYSSCCSEELAIQEPSNQYARSCWYGGDGIGHRGWRRSANHVCRAGANAGATAGRCCLAAG